MRAKATPHDGYHNAKPHVGLNSTAPRQAVAMKKPVHRHGSRTVHFCLNANTTHSLDFTRDNSKESWLTLEDDVENKREIFSCVLAAREQSPSNDTACTRGLEHLINASWNKERTRSIQQTRQVVLEWQNRPTVSSTKLANIYALHSADIVHHALRMGLQDMIAAMEIHFEWEKGHFDAFASFISHKMACSSGLVFNETTLGDDDVGPSIPSVCKKRHWINAQLVSRVGYRLFSQRKKTREAFTLENSGGG